MAGEVVWRHYHGRMREIAREWAIKDAALDDDVDEQLRAVALMRASARDMLRAEVRELVSRGFGGPFLIPV